MAHGIKIDPAIERWAHLRENTHLYFAWNKRTTRRSLFWLAAVPVGLTYLAYKTQGVWDFAASQTKAEMWKEDKKEASQ
ncbi:hypothetical protein RO3G_05662 [Lichtheimia corymbifera JMRC:FSU:9682]|uniref:NADH-ubiquinone oxidoreductase B15 subunit n=2 Tax=Lichtheimia TaxID=688353 RepID=A0A068RR14_9FUNG|nr:uncharacterized protein O0I10_000529 [Lichtheimia ornata]KAI7882017.1 hypothetical protein K492DRAFT_160866 [Lichtheimia hyalospora FSU 10163]KAJ8663290.1 hypothetical protein O0I10_000529 [Lichtheimia ornata]CDH52603.1 hypothetical protein RO3G_05662 [Lichtheimia corymbifera JMRC:FSU:9682]